MMPHNPIRITNKCPHIRAIAKEDMVHHQGASYQGRLETTPECELLANGIKDQEGTTKMG